METREAADRFVRFGGAGPAVVTRDYWHTVAGHREPEGRLFLR
ncbi:hypothetical protein [Streptomyces dysideae]|nr:hypothetical protein [Streptomyces dysideae]